jgi:predicted RNA-binding Zn-ribbon protein involved in translation (DUF1610 family)
VTALRTLTRQDPAVARAATRGRMTHLELPDTRAATGPIIEQTGRPDWEADTACGQRMLVIRLSRQAVNITCPACVATIIAHGRKAST